MSYIKPTLTTKKKVAAGAAVVALSGFVPQPLVQQAQAATTTITVSGSFSSGISILTTVGVNLGTIVATAITGTAKIAANGNTGAVGATIVANAAKGKIKAKYAVQKPLDIIVSGFGTLGGAITNATLDKIYFSGVAGPGTVTGGAATTTASVIATAMNSAAGTKTLNLGAGVVWTGAFPKTGAFTKAVNVTLQF